MVPIGTIFLIAHDAGRNVRSPLDGGAMAFAGANRHSCLPFNCRQTCTSACEDSGCVFKAQKNCFEDHLTPKRSASAFEVIQNNYWQEVVMSPKKWERTVW